MARAEIVDIPKNKEMCINCRKVLAIKNNFYAINDNAIEHKVYKNGCIPICKNCLNEMCYTDKKQTKIDIESFKMVLAILQIPFKEDVFNEMIKNNSFTLGDYKNKVSFMCKNDIYYNQSETKTDNEEDKINKVSVKEDDFEITQDMITTWGKGYNETDYIKLENFYNELCDKYDHSKPIQVNNFKNMAKIQLKADNCLKENDLDNYKKIMGVYSQLAGDSNIKPSQEKDDNESQKAFGLQVKQIEETRPIILKNPEWKDIDEIEKNMNIYFFGHLARMMNIKNDLANEYEKVMGQYKVEVRKEDEESLEGDNDE